MTMANHSLSFPNRVWFGIVELDDSLIDLLNFLEPYEIKEEETIHGTLQVKKWKFYANSHKVVIKVFGKIRARMFLSVKKYSEKRVYTFILNQVKKDKKKVIPKFRLIAFPGDAQGGEFIIRGSKFSIAIVSNDKPAYFKGEEYGRDSGIITDEFNLGESDEL